MAVAVKQQRLSRTQHSGYCTLQYITTVSSGARINVVEQMELLCLMYKIVITHRATLSFNFFIRLT
jgi:hypothetical protein